jgi:hypothetical protein
MRKSALAAICFAGMSFGLLSNAAHAQVVVRVAPPPPVIEHYGPRPHPGYVWVGGYHRWDGAHYVWVGGHWDAPPRPHAVWIAGHWAHRPGGYVFIEGHWR